MRVMTFTASDTCAAYEIIAYVWVEFLTAAAAGVMVLWRRGSGLVDVGGGECRNGVIVVSVVVDIVGSQRRGA
jgi:hypothetical protein